MNHRGRRTAGPDHPVERQHDSRVPPPPTSSPGAVQRRSRAHRFTTTDQKTLLQPQSGFGRAPRLAGLAGFATPPTPMV